MWPDRVRDLPDRADVVIRGGVVLTMADDRPRELDILVEDGAIVELAPTIEHAVHNTIDARGQLVMPGFVDTHWHLWNSFLRGSVGTAPGRDYFTVKRALAPHYTTDDFYWAARFGLAEAVDGGYTTVHNWDHNVRNADDVDANIAAQVDSGLRGRFSYGPRDASEPDDLMDLDGLQAMIDRWDADALDHRISFGAALRGPYRTSTELARTEWSAVRNAGLPITMHCDRCLREDGCRSCGLTRLEKEGLLGPDVQIVHAVHASPADVSALARTGAKISLSPVTELQTMGFPLVSEFLDAGVPTSFSVDTLAMPTHADVFSQLRTVLSVEAARTGSRRVTPYKLLRMATADAASDLDLGEITGSLTVGKRADLQLISRDRNLLPTGDPYDALVFHGRVDNIATVIADGRILKRNGVLVQPSARAVNHEAEMRRDALVRRAKAAGSWPH